MQKLYLVQVLVNIEEYEGADDIISAIDAYLPEDMEVVSVEEYKEITE